MTELAQTYHATEAQVLLRWAVQQGIAVIPGSGSRQHILENLRVPSFTLTPEDCDALQGQAAPRGWFDIKRGPVKYRDEDAHPSQAWTGDHSAH